MSMLAERKHKQKWSLNPRGKHWSDDVNKFGQKMLEKMGWSAGKGLGANLDGVTEHVKVSYKNDSKGMGFKDNGDQWTKHEADFSTLLKNLGGPETTETNLQKPDKSLEQKSRSSRARVHYHKFTRGKDLSLRSEKDLANIFGRKTLERAIDVDEKQENSSDSTENKNFGVLTVESGSMADYFKSKLGKFNYSLSSNNKNTEEDGVESESELNECTGFGFGFSASTSATASNGQQNGNSESSFMQDLKHKYADMIGGKRKRDVEETEEEPSEKKSKKDKKKKKKLAFDNPGLDVNTNEEVCYDNPCLEKLPTITEEEQDSDKQNDKENNLDEPKKKKRKTVTFASPEVEKSPVKIEEQITEKSLKKSKKKKKKSKETEEGIDNLACEESLNDETPTETTLEDVTPKKSKKKSKKQEFGIDNFGCEETSIELQPENVDTNEVKPKKKSKKQENGIDNLGCEETVAEETPKKSKKSKKQENGIDNPGCEVNTIEEGVSSITDAIDNYQTELENEMNERKASTKKKAKKSSAN